MGTELKKTVLRMQVPYLNCQVKPLCTLCGELGCVDDMVTWIRYLRHVPGDLSRIIKLPFF
jgi:hypothetical protein